MHLDTIKKALAALLLVLLTAPVAHGDNVPDGMVNTDGSSVFQPSSGRPVRQARTTRGESYVAGRKSTSTVTVCPGTTCATLVKASAGQVTAIQVFNADATDTWLKFYNKASAPTVGTDTPVKIIYVPHGLGAVIPFPLGLDFATGIAFAVTANPLGTDTTAVTASKTVVNIDYR